MNKLICIEIQCEQPRILDKEKNKTITSYVVPALHFSSTTLVRHLPIILFKWTCVWCLDLPNKEKLKKFECTHVGQKPMPETYSQV